MKKSLLFGMAALAAIPASAGIEPIDLPGWQVSAVSPKGNWVASEIYGSVQIADLVNEKVFTFDSEEGEGYFIGNGNAINNAGIAVGHTPFQSAYFKNGAWTELNVPHPDYPNCANAISADGTRICGYVGLSPLTLEDTKVPMAVPAVWTLQSNGEYGDVEILPYPAFDYFNRVPQYVMLNCISDDGKTIAGQVTDYSGFYVYSIIYKLGDDNKWTYVIQNEELLNPNHLVLPEWPGESPEPPVAENYMTEEEIEAYNAAYEAAIEAGDWDNIPQYADYMTPENAAAYQAACDAYETEIAAYLVKFDAYMEVYNQIMEDGKPMVMNNVCMSPDGKTVLMMSMKSDFDPETWTETFSGGIIAINSTDNSYEIYPDNMMSPTTITEDGTIFGAIRDEISVPQGMVIKPGEKNPISLLDYVSEVYPSTAQWMKENMYHDTEVLNMETWEFETIEDYPFIGYPVCSSNGSLAATHIENGWDFSETAPYTFSYILPLSANASVEGITYDGDSEARWFNLQGLQIDEPTTGIAIKVQNGKSIKIAK